MTSIPAVGGGVIDPEFTVRLRVAVCVNEPDVPEKTTLAVPVVAEADAARLTCCPVPGVSVEVDGVAVTPCGRPLSVIWTEPVNPFTARAVNVTACDDPPAVNVAVVGLN